MSSRKKLANKIEEITDQILLAKIRNIIREYNPDISETKNENGIFIHFGDLKNRTYKEIDNILFDAYSKKITKTSSTPNSEEKTTLTETLQKRPKDLIKKYRLTNTENHILNRVRYEKELKKNEGKEEDKKMTDFNIFVKK